MEKEETGRQPHTKLSDEDRAMFLAELRRTGNRKLASAAIGVEPRLMDQRRRHDPELDREWEEAAETAHRRFSGADGPFDFPEGTGPGMIRRGKNGRLQLVEPGEGRWCAEVQERFLDRLRATGNVRAAARAVGFSESAVWTRRRKHAALAQAMEEMLDEAELAMEYRIACMGGETMVAPQPVIASGAKQASAEPLDCRGASAPRNDDGVEAEAALPFDLDAAMRFLKWREEKRRGRGRRTPRAKPPSIEEVTEKIIRRVEAIERHRQRDAGGDHE